MVGVGPFISLLENDFDEVEHPKESAALGISLIQIFLKYGYLFVSLTDTQRDFFRKNKNNENLDPVTIEALARNKDIFPVSKMVKDYKSLLINKENFDHIIFSGYFSQPIISLFCTQNIINCQYEYIDQELSEGCIIIQNQWNVRCYSSLENTEKDRLLIEDIAKAFIFKFQDHSFTDNPLPIIDKFPQLLIESKSMNSSMQDYNVTKAKELGIRIAYLNSWEKDINLTRINNRVVFRSGYSNHYLTIDTQHPHFELHDIKGVHEGSIPYSGGKPTNKKPYHLNVS